MQYKFIWPKYSFVIFLTSLLALLLFSSYLAEYESANLITRLFLSITLLTSVYLLSHEKMHLYASALLAVPTISINWASEFFTYSTLQNLSMLANTVFFGYIGYLILARLFAARVINLNIIFAAISLYFLMGLEFGYMFALVEWNNPGSLTTSVLSIREDLAFRAFDESINSFFYYSLVTLTTLGYGDIIPVNPMARALSTIEAVAGQMYLTVLVARLVGTHISQKLE